MTRSINDNTQVLIDDFGVDDDTIQNALEVRRQRGGALDTALFENGLSEEIIVSWMSRVLELPTTTYAEIREIPQELAQQFPRHVAETFRVFPVELGEEKAVLVCYQPLLERLSTQLRHRLNRELEFHVTSETGFHAGLEHLYGKPPRPRWASIIEELEAKVQETQKAEKELEELGLNEVNEEPATAASASETRTTIAFWAIGERRGDELVISAMSTQSDESPTVIPSMSLPWLPVDNEPKSLSAEELNQSALGETLKFRAGDWIAYASEVADLSVYVFSVDGGLPEVEKLALDIALGRYRSGEEATEHRASLDPEVKTVDDDATLISQLVVPQTFSEPPSSEPDLGKVLGLLTSNNPELWEEGTQMIAHATQATFDGFLRDNFPGSVHVDPISENSETKPLKSYSGILALASNNPERASEVVKGFLESNAMVTRYFATQFFAEYAAQLEFDLRLVARRLFDRERKIRRAALNCLCASRDKPGYSDIISIFEERLKLPVPANQVATIHILGQLRELRGVTHVVNLCASDEPMVARAAQSFMALITGHHFGADIEAWKAWWVNHGHAPRSVWLVRALRSRDARLRQVAIDELGRLHQGKTFGFDPNARSPRREKSVRQWEELLEEEELQA